MNSSGRSQNNPSGSSGNAGNLASNFQQNGGFMNAGGGFQGMLNPAAMAGLSGYSGGFQNGLGGGFQGGFGGGSMSDLLAMQEMMDSNKRRRLQEMANSHSSS